MSFGEERTFSRTPRKMSRDITLQTFRSRTISMASSGSDTSQRPVSMIFITKIEDINEKFRHNTYLIGTLIDF